MSPLIPIAPAAVPMFSPEHKPVTEGAAEFEVLENEDAVVELEFGPSKLETEAET